MSNKRPTRGTAVPSSRLSRLWHLGMASGSLAAGIGVKGLMELGRRGQESTPARIALSGPHAQRFTRRLARMRGAVMKMGQLMSMDGTDIFTPEAAEIMSVLRQSAEPMPLGQLGGVLNREYGKGWETRFARMHFTPIAAASIGQVHRAETRDGRQLALKVQFPGVRDSIDSDISNLSFLLRNFPLMPSGIDPAPLLEEARLQLHRETDYAAEADAMEAYADRVGDDPDLFVPRPHRDLTTECVLAMDFAEGEPVDRVMQGDYTRADRDRIAGLLAMLSFRELFEFGLVQTDPNFSNYLYDGRTRRVTLLDFGAAQAVAPQWVNTYRRMARAALEDDRDTLHDACATMGYIGDDTPAGDVEEMIRLLLMSAEPIRHPGPYDFGASDLFERVYHRGRELFLDDRFRNTPVPGTLFLHRKFMGTFMLCRKLRARVDIGRMLADHL
ncbi:ABC transporter [Ectothiorhodospira shaposhnikovii]|uniref:ABC1 kinase family protein n=1 Tax=Ectothiorhodospira shaposhnikovii TaxID=1054 RepID=UPI001908B847|nr:AarF/ABC1/UbiB kinase family protein [Ectothiorhodospira shaposhnikovii]MBK1671760.1 ABC transporter [Ectothiorhodospira shaposhnikovii]